MSSKKVIKKEVFINASKELVFECLTKEEHIISYFPLDKVQSTWEEGSSIVFIGKQTGKDLGTITKLIKNELFSFRYWNENHFTKKALENEVLISYKLKDSENGTSLNLEQSNLPSDDYFNIMNPMWETLLNGFKNYVESK